MDKEILFLLGSGCSVDSGLFTYRGDTKYENYREVNNQDTLDDIWKYLRPLYESISNASLGNTYIKLQELLDIYPNSDIFTQNIDCLANNLKINGNIVELHGNVKHMYCTKCKTKVNVDFNNLICDCKNKYRPNIILLGENLNPNTSQMIGTILKNKYKYVLIIGTTLQFPYLRDIVNKAKGKKAQIIHINPDEKYDNPQCIKNTHYSVTKTRYESNVRKNEIFLNMTAAEGIEHIINNKNIYF